MTSPDPAHHFGRVGFYAALGKAFTVMCLFVPGLAMVEAADYFTGGRVDAWMGIWPREASGLRGLFLAPFVHDGWQHLLSNSSALIILGTFAFAAGTGRFFVASGLIAVVSGMVVWYTTPPGVLVVGASGLIFGWIGLLFMRGLVEHTWWHLVVAIIVGLLYGAQFKYLMPGDERISWQGHLAGFLAGLVAAVATRRAHPKPAAK